MSCRGQCKIVVTVIAHVGFAAEVKHIQMMEKKKIIVL